MVTFLNYKLKITETKSSKNVMETKFLIEQCFVPTHPLKSNGNLVEFHCELKKVVKCQERLVHINLVEHWIRILWRCDKTNCTDFVVFRSKILL